MVGWPTHSNFLNDSYEVVNVLIGWNGIDLHTYLDALVSAVENGHRAIMNLLVENGSIGTWSKAWAYRYCPVLGR